MDKQVEVFDRHIPLCEAIALLSSLIDSVLFR